MNCLICENCAGYDGARIDCAATAAAPITAAYPGSGAHPWRFDPAIVRACEAFAPVEMALSEAVEFATAKNMLSRDIPKI